MFSWTHAGFVAMLIVGGTALTSVSSAQETDDGGIAAIGNAFTYQGRLRVGGSVPPDANYAFQFRLFSVASGGAAIAGPLNQNLFVRDGLFTTSIDFGASAFNGDRRWLEITIGGVVLAPRIELTPAPHALFAAAPWITAGSNISYTAGSVGIGTENPLALLSLRRNSSAPALSLDTPDGSYSFAVFNSAGTQRGIVGYGRTGNIFVDQLDGSIALRSERAVQIGSGPNSDVTISENGFVGLGLTNPVASLHVNTNNGGEVRLSKSNAGTQLLRMDGGGGTTNQLLALERSAGDSVFIGNYFTEYQLFGSAAKNLGLGTNNRTNDLTIAPDGAVGIGTTETSHRAVIQHTTNDTLRLIGPGQFGANNTLNFGDDDYVFIREDTDDNLTIHAVGGNGGRLRVRADTIEWQATKPATVKLDDGQSVKLYAEEAAEVYFTDYGASRLDDGAALIRLDPTFLQTVVINDRFPLKVYVQVEGDCNGVFVANKSESGFEVRELQNGHSDAPFSYRVVAHRKHCEYLRLANEEADKAANRLIRATMWNEPDAPAKNPAGADPSRSLPTPQQNPERAPN
ncbi:MAG: hypothetical protein JNG88_17165 [Phycisphaerales bacterium]|nr:hypothetical protein [Phycisphaerales bacterium]